MQVYVGKEDIEHIADVMDTTDASMVSPSLKESSSVQFRLTCNGKSLSGVFVEIQTGQHRMEGIILV